MKILFLTPYPHSTAPSQRFRFEQYYELLRNEGIMFDIHSFLDDHTWQILYKQGQIFSKVLGIVLGWGKRIWLLFFLWKYDFVFIHREAAPLGPPILEFLISKVFRKKIIYDFDDAIWLPNTSDNNKIAALTKCHWKVKYICKWSYKVSCGNEYLSNYARQFNKNVVLNPTTIDTVHHHNLTIDYSIERPVIGWTGTHSTLHYLDFLETLISELEQKYSFDFIVICDKAPNYKWKALQYIQWNKSTEIEDLAKINIGVMPLTADIWSEGKCGFKGLQYMSLGIPTIMSPVGVNKRIIQHGENGYLAESIDEWKVILIDMIQDSSRRKKIGQIGQNTIKNEYSVESNTENFVKLFYLD